MKRVLFIVFDGQNKKIDKATKSSVDRNLGKEDTMVFVKFDDPDRREMYYGIKDDVNKIINDVYNFDYVCIVPNGTILNDETKVIFSEYQKEMEGDVKEVYLSLALYVHDDTTVVMNKHVWNSTVAYEAGVLDIDLATRQIDSTIFGGFIPTDLFFNKDFYNSAISYYQQYHLLNHLAETNLVLGIPKILTTINNWDFKMTEINDEEKIKYFTMARENWVNKKA